ncbi:ABC transporter permease subunit [Paraburkholderia sp. D15]|uniref:ABC transporter permease subunit n=1 Tax=Paraburkholderia sp. D15 TaxID=2880218 RepID=UPI002478EA24|nr:ABC transporter permease subunit [Paraburkholderia sp. D15]WGS53243.1 ABC transporter permease subunit [Paraburkholderia sp. D15]
MSDTTLSAAQDNDTAGLQRIVPIMPRRGFAFPRGLQKLAGLAFLIALWIVATSRGWIAFELLPAPWDIWHAFVELIVKGELGSAMALSLRRVAIGFAIGFSVGVLLAVPSGLLRAGEALIDAPVQMIRTMPWAGLVPLLLIWFGIDEEPKIALVALAVVFPIYFNLFAGIRNVDQGLVEAAQTLGFSRAELIFHVVLPGALPTALVGLRYALGSAWLALVFAEQVNSQGGLGYLVTFAREVYRTDIIVVCLIIYALLGLAADFSVRVLEKGLLSWRPAFRAR